MTLDEHLLDAHAKGNTSALVDLYTQAAKQSTQTDAHYFFLTQAYIFALDCGAVQAETLARQLKTAKRL